MQRQTLADRLDEELDTGAYADVDASANGLQIAETTATREIDHVAFAVDAVTATAEAAADAGADLLVTHHGVVWGGLDRVTDRTYDRVAAFTDRDLDLYVSHLPLDGHPEHGNAAGVADCLGLEDREPFGSLGPETIGQLGVAGESYTTGELTAVLESELDHDGEGVQVLDFGPEEIETVAVVTGAGGDWLDEAVVAGADALVTGEGEGRLYHEARESGISVFLAGHYATETFGVAALAELVADWDRDLETTVLSHPTGL
ncbi:Nif3-like dinuclear metal center hexameric protein [Halobaculum sp. MBLA0143]|uniref:Nif3-like dinuclear metal center hexameric protein n=1 Tax=Halobaculum sp. MBLA0143 TaxID=3079933 RepID=UPI003524A956